MKCNNKVLAAAIASCLVSGSAFALAPSAIDPQNPTSSDLVIHYGGATAQNETVTALTNQLCDLNTKDEYTNSTGGTARVVTCTLKTTADVPAAVQGKNLYFSYYLNGGSIYGVTPVIDQVSLNYMKVNGGNCNYTVGGTPGLWTCDNLAPNQYPAAPVAGGSDVEPALFKGSSLVGLAFGAPTGTSYFADQAYNVIFGLAMNCALLDHSVYTSCQGKGIASGPVASLSKESAASIMAQGGFLYWEQVPEYGMVADNNSNGIPDMEDYFEGTIPGTPIHVCRRKPGSGTQASAQAWFLNQECGSPSRAFVTQATAGIPGEVEEIASSTGILTTCVDVNANAIGISSLEKQPNRTDDKYGHMWEYVAIDGVMPTSENAAIGKYDYMFENSMQYNTAVATPEQAAFIQALFTRAKDAKDLRDTVTHLALPGVLGLPDGVVNIPGDSVDANNDGIPDFDNYNGNGIITEYVPNNPVAWVTRNGLACKPHLSVFP